MTLSMKKRLKLAFLFLLRENLIELLAVVVFLVLSSGVLIALLEPDISFGSGIWWSIVTLTTVGYGDISPATAGGKVLASIIMFFGIGLLGTFSASFAAILIDRKIRKNRGMCSSAAENHIIICEWNHRAKAILKELRADPRTQKISVVLLADIEEKPVDDPDLIFIRGSADEETLKKANLEKAGTVIVLGDDSMEPGVRDAKVVLTALTVESMHRNVYSIVELADKSNEQHCLRANADEIIIGSELSSHLIASAASDHGISRIVSELLSSRYGHELYSMPVPQEMVGTRFLDLFINMKTDRDITVFGIQKGRGGTFFPNPAADYPVAENDLLMVIAKDRGKA